MDPLEGHCSFSPALPLAPSPFAPGWSPWLDPGLGTLLAMSGAVDGPPDLPIMGLTRGTAAIGEGMLCAGAPLAPSSLGQYGDTGLSRGT